MSNFEEVVEKFLRPRALEESFDHSTWSDERNVWVLSEALDVNAEGAEGPVFTPATLNEAGGGGGGIIMSTTANTLQIKLVNGKVINPPELFILCHGFGNLTDCLCRPWK